MTDTYGKHNTYADGEVLYAQDVNQHIDFRTYSTKALADSAVAGWDSTQIGRMILVSGEGKWYYWNGSALAGFPSVGGSGAPTDAKYVLYGTTDDPGLSADTLHSALTGADLHICKLHDSTHEDGGSDEISVAGLSGVLADEQDAGKIKGVDVDDGDIADNNTLVYNSVTGNLEYEPFPAGTGDMTKAVILALAIGMPIAALLLGHVFWR